jgi:hypothetical protein
MFQLIGAARRSSRRSWLVAGGVVGLLLAFALLWIGRATAGKAGPTRANSPTHTFSNIPIPKADAVDSTSEPCTAAPSYNDMPDMSKTFKLGGTASRPVIVLFQAQWTVVTDSALIQLTIDGVVRSEEIIVDARPSGVAHDNESHGYDFVTDALTPGMHTATIQWRDGGGGPACIDDRSMIILHK